ncbi:MAG: hypothetical protein IJ363_03350 [Clostridia bacterium]|nr:hypothetical protein [Clostridia bacterium]
MPKRHSFRSGPSRTPVPTIVISNPPTNSNLHFLHIFFLKPRKISRKKVSYILKGSHPRKESAMRQLKMLRPAAFTLRPLGTCPKEIDCPEPKKLVLPKEGLEDLGERKVVWSDLDGNGHLFSGNYGDIVWDYLPAGLQDKVLKDFAINYSREAKFGDVLQLRGIQTEEGYLMEGLGPGGVCFTAKCVFA